MGPLHECMELDGELFDALVVDVAHHGDNEPLFGVHGHPDVVVLFQDNLAGGRVQACVDPRMGLQDRRHGLERKNGERQAPAESFNILLVLPAEEFEPGNVHVILAVHVGDLGPGEAHLFGRGPADGAEGNPLHRTPL